MVAVAGGGGEGALRGLMLPQLTQVVRTDAGNLGAGIYFADAAPVSAAYSRPSSHGRRYMVMCTVALGKSHEVRPPPPHCAALAVESAASQRGGSTDHG